MRISELFLIGLLLCLLQIRTGLSVKSFPNSVIRSVNYFFLDSTSPLAEYTLDSLKDAKNMGANMIAIQFAICQTEANSSVVYPGPLMTPSEIDVVNFINYIKSYNMMTFFKPLILPNNSDATWTFVNVNATDPALWFASYTQIMLTYSSLAEDHGIYGICIGLELTNMIQYTSHWITLIHKIRQIFHGKLSYCSNPLNSETQSVQFWTSLDFIGLDLYVPLVNPLVVNPNLTPTYSEMVNEFSNIWNNFIYDWYIQTYNNSIPIFITEMGYPSNNQGLQFPWVLPNTDIGCVGVYAENQTAQAVAYEVMASQLSPLMPTSIIGFNMFWFDNPSTSDYLYNPKTVFNCSWTPKNKLAFQVFQQLYAISPSSSKSQMLTNGEIVAIVVGGFALIFCMSMLVKYWYFNRSKTTNLLV